MAFLAKESHVSIEYVNLLYGEELAKLTVGAHLRAFLPIFAIRKVREALLLRSAETHNVP
jgi:hypothetical protein